MLREDRRSEPRVGERVPYVVVYGSPGLPLIQLVRRSVNHLGSIDRISTCKWNMLVLINSNYLYLHHYNYMQGCKSFC